MFFFQKKMVSHSGMAISENERAKISKRVIFLKLLISAISGGLLAMAFPPLNLQNIAFIAVVPMILLNLYSNSYKFAFFNGCFFGFSCSIFSFWWLREINYAIPFMLSGILMIFCSLFTIFNFWSNKYILYSANTLLKTYEARQNQQTKFHRELFWVISNAAAYPFIDYIRINLFPWNFLGVTQSNNLSLIQIVEYTGIYGISFLIMLINLSFALTIYLLFKAFKSGRIYRGRIAIFSISILFLSYLWGAYLFNRKAKDLENAEFKKLRIGVVQGDISQRRNSNFSMAKEALDAYLDLTNKLLDENKNLDLVIWPETAVPYPYWGSGGVSLQYRYSLNDIIREHKVPFLIGSLDFTEEINGEYELTNSALFINSNGRIIDKYDKIFRVPYGEFVPMRSIMPKFLLKIIDMGRDLRAGTDFEPIEIADGVHAGMSICYESIFAKLWRRETQLGANFFIAINNDAWYPTSSEPEQHFANARFRAIESNRYAMRVGNNGGTVAINNRGEITHLLMDNLIDRGCSYGVFELAIPVNQHKLTFYTKFGDIFLLMLGVILGILTLYGITNQLKMQKKLNDLL